MSLSDIKALTFDTGGTILDWHSGFKTAFAAAGERHEIQRDWAALANDLRRRSMGAMLNLGEHETPAYNFDGAHRAALDALLADEGLEMFDEADRRAISWEAPHRFQCWPDFPAILPRLRERYIVASFTILSYRLIIDTARANGLSWDAVFSCEGWGKYKLLPEAYERTAAALQLQPAECLMVACHGFDLDAARRVGYRTALVRRPLEWGGADAQVGAAAEGGYDIEVDDFPGLEAALAS